METARRKLKKPESTCCLRRHRGDRRSPWDGGPTGAAGRSPSSSHGGQTGRPGPGARRWGAEGQAAVGGPEGLKPALRPRVDCRGQGQAWARGQSELEGWLLGRRRAGEGAAEGVADLPPVRWAKRTPRAGPEGEVLMKEETEQAPS